MKFLVTFYLIILCCQFSPGQNAQQKMWDFRFGGSKNEAIGHFISTKDKGYLLGGSSFSGMDGNKSQPNQDTINVTSDYWIVKLDSNGIKQWDKRYGGTRSESLTSLIELPDGGYLLGGTSYSPASGDKTGALHGEYDIWMVRIDSVGTLVWEKNFGGDFYANLSTVVPTSDNGFLLGGWVVSGISGDVSQPTKGAGDYWVVKIAANGSKQWDKRFGGESGDVLTAIVATSDLGFLLCGHSESETGDFTAPLKGLTDFRFLKINANGGKVWDKTIGSCLNDWAPKLIPVHDGSYLVAGFTNAGICGDKSQYSWNTSQDTWAVKVNANAGKIWDKNFGGSQFETIQSIAERPDHKFVLVSTSNSPVSGDKTESNLGETQAWVVITDSAGNKLSDKTILTNGTDHQSRVVVSGAGCMTLLVQTNGSVGGFKTQPNWDATLVSNDLWVVKFCDSTGVTTTNSPLIGEAADIFPNPFAKEIQIRIRNNGSGKASFGIKNILGQTVAAGLGISIQDGISEPIEVKNLKKGIYFLELELNGKTISKKLIRE